MSTHTDRGRVPEARSHALALCGKMLVADASGALYWPGERTLLVADLHLEKGSSAARRGRMLPPYDTRETLQRLAATIDTYEPARIIALGDSLHDREAAQRIDAEDLAILRLIQEDRDWIWITGNHDPEIAPLLGGIVMEEMEVEGVALRHAPRAAASTTHEIAGHYHPAARLSLYGHSVRRPCFIGNGRRLVLPAFGAFTGGLNVLDEAFLPVFGHNGFNVMMLGQEGVYPVATRNLRED
jgi:uncharacterized protein